MTEHRLLLFGYPVAHSLSPAMHNAALQAMGFSGWSYTAQAVLSEDLSQAVALLRQPEFSGANVTIPHKELILPLLDRLTPAASAIGAVNTIFKERDTLVGDNTDAPGFLADLKRQLLDAGRAVSPSTNGQRAGNSVNGLHFTGKALVMGAGGSARAVVYALHHAGWQILLASRRLEQAQSLAAAYPPGSVQPIFLHPSVLSTFTPHPSSCTILVNTTPLGMHPYLEECPWPVSLPLPPSAFVYDLVYRPAETVLLGRARSAGLPHANGLGMLVEQAALSFELWTGRVPPRALMVQAVQV